MLEQVFATRTFLTPFYQAVTLSRSGTVHCRFEETTNETPATYERPVSSRLASELLLSTGSSHAHKISRIHGSGQPMTNPLSTSFLIFVSTSFLFLVVRPLLLVAMHLLLLASCVTTCYPVRSQRLRGETVPILFPLHETPKAMRTVLCVIRGVIRTLLLVMSDQQFLGTMFATRSKGHRY